MPSLAVEHRRQRDQRQGPTLVGDDLLAVRGHGNVSRGQAEGPADGVLWNGDRLTRRFHQQRLERGQGNGHQQLELRALAGRRPQLDLASELGNLVPDDIQTDPPAGDFGQLARGGEATAQEEPA